MSLASILVTAAPALLPALQDGIRGLIAKFTGSAGSRPQNVAEAIELMKAENERFRILADLDKPGDVHMWVADLRALQRPALATLILGGYVLSVMMITAKGGDMATPPPLVEQLGQYAAMVSFYLFGHWGYSSAKGAR